MKKIILFIIFATPFLLSSCYDKKEVEMTAAKDLCGQWVVTDSVNGTEFVLTTSNLSSNSSDSIFITDVYSGKGGFWNFQVKAKANPEGLTFAQDSTISMVLMDEVLDKKDYNGDGIQSAVVPFNIKVNVKKGMVEKNAVAMPSGVKSDKITLYLEFEDEVDEDQNPLPFHTTYAIHGYRKTGFHEDDTFVLPW